MTINGLPAHFLLIHVVVVLLPLTAFGAILASIWPAAQRKLTFLIPLGAVIGAVVVPITTRAGNDFWNHLGRPAFVLNHRNLGNLVLPWTIALAVTTIAQWWLLRRGQPARWLPIVVSVAVVVSAVGTIVIVVLTGEAGSRAVWGGR
jgi:hypothetical protein